MKRSIEWHEQCAVNARKNIDAEIERMNQIIAKVKRSESEYAFRIEQIAEAKKRGLTEFDAEKLLVKKGKQS